MTKLVDIMTKDPVTVRPEQTAMEVSEIFNASSFHHLPVVSSNGEIVGMVSKTDLDQHSIGMSLFANQDRQSYTDALYQTLLVEFFMTKELMTLEASNSITDAYNLFKTHQFRAIPVVDGPKLVGIITPIDLVKPFIEIV